MEINTVRQAMVFLAREFGFEKNITTAQDVVELAFGVIKQGEIEFTEDVIEKIIIHVKLENGIEINETFETEYENN